MLKKLFNSVMYGVRFSIVSQNWRPADIEKLNERNRFVRSLLERTWVPTANIDITGKNTGNGLTDETLAYDLPFLLARHAGIQSLDFSNNAIGKATLSKIRESLLFTKLNILNLSGNRLDKAAKQWLPRLLELNKLETLALQNCNLKEKDIQVLITALERNTSLQNLDISENGATDAQITQINRLLTRNNSYYHYQNTFHRGNILDLERCTLDKEQLEDLAFYIQNQSPAFFERASLKEIKMPNLDAGMKEEDFNLLIQALKKNNRVTSLTMNFEGVSAAVEQQIRTQLMLNQARASLMGKPASFLSTIMNHYIVKAMIAAQLLTALIPALPFFHVIIGAMAVRFASQAYFSRQLDKAKTLDLTQPENTAAIQLGKEAAHSWLAYFNPKAYTPMAYLGYTIEREKLSTKYDVQAECFQPVAPKAKI